MLPHVQGKSFYGHNRNSTRFVNCQSAVRKTEKIQDSKKRAKLGLRALFTFLKPKSLSCNTFNI